ncbi:hypothetical protein STEG23_033734, partial [Scotinomys teguina]
MVLTFAAASGNYPSTLLTEMKSESVQPVGVLTETVHEFGIFKTTFKRRSHCPLHFRDQE